MRLKTLGAVHTHTHTHTPSLYEITENKIEKYKRGLCQYVNRHKQ